MVSCMISVDFLKILGNSPAALAGPGTGDRQTWRVREGSAGGCVVPANPLLSCFNVIVSLSNLMSESSGFLKGPTGPQYCFSLS